MVTLQRILLCAPPGSGLRESTERVVARLRDQCNMSVRHEDVEDALDEPIRRVVRRPRHIAIGRWQEALRRSIDQLNSSDDEIKILSCHLTLYNRIRSEFYSPVTPTIFVNLDFIPDRIVVLLDDIFDMLRRLSQEDTVPGLFSASTDESTFIARSARTLGHRRIDDLSSEDKSLLRLEHKVRSLVELLGWRRAEIVHSEQLASQLDANFIPYGVKHNIDGLIAACRFLPKDTRTIYVSHPISRPRRETRDGNEWPLVVSECNHLPEVAAKWRCVPIMPTAIDEYRLEQPAGGLLSRRPLLDPRWPSQAMAGSLIFSEDVSFSDAERCFLMPDNYEDMSSTFRTAIAALMRGLEASISTEVPFRDHLIVAYAEDLLVFRPLYREGYFSGGVEKELLTGMNWRMRCLGGGILLSSIHTRMSILP